MNLDEIKDLIDTVVEKDITEFEWETGKQRLRIRRGSSDDNGKQASPAYVMVTSHPGMAGEHAAPPLTPAQEALPSPEPKPEPRESEKPPAVPEAPADHLIVTSPIVGTFYESSSPGAPAYVEVGDRVEAGQVLCIIEAMKLMNEIEAEVGGIIMKRFVSNLQPVEYGEALFAIDSKG